MFDNFQFVELEKSEFNKQIKKGEINDTNFRYYYWDSENLCKLDSSMIVRGGRLINQAFHPPLHGKMTILKNDIEKK